MQVRVVLKQTAVINYSIETAKWVISRTRIHARSESHRIRTCNSPQRQIAIVVAGFSKR